MNDDYYCACNGLKREGNCKDYHLFRLKIESGVITTCPQASQQPIINLVKRKK